MLHTGAKTVAVAVGIVEAVKVVVDEVVTVHVSGLYAGLFYMLAGRVVKVVATKLHLVVKEGEVAVEAAHP